MKQPLFCVKCGQKLTPNTNTCPKCGTDIFQLEKNITTENEITPIDGIANTEIFLQYQDKIELAVIEAYLTDTKLIRNGLYTKGMILNFTKEMVDKVISDCEQKLSAYITYLEKLYKNGTLLMLDVTDEIKEECAEYAVNLGLSFSEGESIYDKFIKSNHIGEKFGILMTMLISYGETGQFDDNLIKESDNITTEFKSKEYVRLKKAVEELSVVQSALHKKSGSLFLTEDDRTELYEKGMLLGFQNKDFIIIAIKGNEIKLGYHEKVLEQEMDKLKLQNQNKFSNIVSPKKSFILDKEIEFGSCYFIEKYINEFFSQRIQSLKDATIQKYKKLNVSSCDFRNKFLFIFVPIATLWGDCVRELTSNIGLEPEFYDSMKNCFSDYFSSFVDDWNQIAQLFSDIDNEVELSKLKGKMNKALRGKWVVGGFGIKGMIGGAITGSILNAGTGLAYDAINGVLSSVKNHNAQNAKMKLIDSLLPAINEFFDILKNNTPVVYIALITEKYPYSIWIEDDVYETKLYQKYCQASHDNEDEESIVSLVIRILLSNPYKSSNYEHIFSHIHKKQKSESQQKDVDELIRVANWFAVEKEVKTSIFTSFLEKCDGINMQTCETLLEIETLLREKSITAENRVYNEYLSNLMKNKLVSFSSDEINSTLTLLEDFYNKFEFPISTHIEKLKQLFFKHYCISFKTNNTNAIISNLKQLKKYNESCSWDLSKHICEQEQKLSSILEEQDKQSRTVEIITAYDVSSGNFVKEKALAKTVEDKEKMISALPILESDCKKITFNMKREDFEAVISKMRILCHESGLNESFIESLILEWNEQDEKARTVRDKVYSTREEANFAMFELGLIDKAYKEYGKSLTQKYFSIMNYPFKTEQAKSAIQQKEQELLKHVSYLRNNSKFDVTDKTCELSKLISSSIKYIAITILLLIVGSLFNNGLVSVILLIVIIGIWVSFFRKCSETKVKIESDRKSAQHHAEELAEFNAIFIIVDNHIIPKNTPN